MHKPPVPFCEVEAPGISPPGRRHALTTCLVCYQEGPAYVAVGRCGHAEVCWLCAVRLRSLLRDFRCPVCKDELPEVNLVVDAAADVPVDSKKAFVLDRKNGISCASAEARTEVERLFNYTCWLRGCGDHSGLCFPTLAGLKTHLLEEHGRKFCPTCLVGRKVFLFEQFLYSPEDLDRHHREGDGPGELGRSLPPTPPHANCRFCKKSLYSQDELLDHMHKRHHLCSLCERQGRRGEYYLDFAYLSLHYEEQHHVCTHDDCRRGSYRLVAFASEDELQIHRATEHPSKPKVSQHAKKHGTRVNIQIGAESYRVEQERRRQVQGQALGRGQLAAVGRAQEDRLVVSGDVRVRFMWTQGQPVRDAQTEDDGSRLAEPGCSDGREEREEDRYPPRPAANGAWARRRVAVAATSSKQPPEGNALSDRDAGNARHPPSGTAILCSGLGSGSGPNPHSGITAGTRDDAKGLARRVEAGDASLVVASSRTRLGLLSEALREVQLVGLDYAMTMKSSEYSERNRSFRAELEAAFGTDRLAEFKVNSVVFRRSLAGDASVSGAARTYAEQVLDVFSAVGLSTGEQSAARLLSELVILLPDKVPRHSLHSELLNLHDREVAVHARQLDQTSQAAAFPTIVIASRKGLFARRRDAAVTHNAGIAGGEFIDASGGVQAASDVRGRPLVQALAG